MSSADDSPVPFTTQEIKCFRRGYNSCLMLFDEYVGVIQELELREEEYLESNLISICLI